MPASPAPAPVPGADHSSGKHRDGATGYTILRYGHDYIDIGEAQYEARFRERRLASLRHTAKALGFSVIPDSNAA